MCIHICIYIHTYVYIYIYIERERERIVYIYIYMYIAVLGQKLVVLVLAAGARTPEGGDRTQALISANFSGYSLQGGAVGGGCCGWGSGRGVLWMGGSIIC